jgi:hypothetical protein
VCNGFVVYRDDNATIALQPKRGGSEKVVEADATIVEQLEKLPEQLRAALRESDDPFWAAALPADIKEHIETLTRVVERHPKFGNGRIFRLRSKQLHLHPGNLARVMILLAAKHDATAALDWLIFISEVQKASIRYSAEIYGLKVSKRISLPNGVEMANLSDFANSGMSRWLLSYPYAHAHFSGSPISWEPPVVASLIEVDVGAQEGWIGQTDPSIPVFTKLFASVLAFTIADDFAPYVGRSWVEFVDPRLTFAEQGRAHYSARSEGALASVIPKQVDENAMNWVFRYLALEEAARRRLDIAIERLSIARRRRSLNDKAIEGAICLEALLLEKDARQELGYRLAVRGARLLGANFDERAAVRRGLTKFYGLRSTAVHGDLIDENKRKDVLDGLEACTRILQRIVQLGGAPDWNRIELE